MKNTNGSRKKLPRETVRETAERTKREREGEIETGTGIGCETDAIETGTETEGMYTSKYSNTV